MPMLLLRIVFVVDGDILYKFCYCYNFQIMKKFFEVYNASLWSCCLSVGKSQSSDFTNYWFKIMM